MLVCLLALLSACSGGSDVPQTLSMSQEDLLLQAQTRIDGDDFPVVEAAWSVRVDETPKVPNHELFHLVPTSLIDGEPTDAEIRRSADGTEYHLTIEWLTGSLSVTAEPAVSCQRSDVTWTPVEVRGGEGCETNEAGPYSLRWAEEGTSFYYTSTDITWVEARKMLDEWEPLKK